MLFANDMYLKNDTLCITMTIETDLKEWGNSLAIIIPAEKAKELKLKKGDKVDIDIVAKKRINAFGICKGAKSFEEEEESHKEFW